MSLELLSNSVDVNNLKGSSQNLLPPIVTNINDHIIKSNLIKSLPMSLKTIIPES